MSTHLALIDEINATHPAYGTCSIWWLGQHGFVVKGGDTTIYLDAFLTPLDGRTVAPLLFPEEVVNADIIFGSHDHADHIDRPAWPGMATASPRARFVVPQLFKERLADDLHVPRERFTGIDDGMSVDIGGVRATGIAAAHEFLDRDAATGHYPYLGCIFEFNGVTLFHSGDTCVYEGMLTKLRAWNFDLMFLPINGRCGKRLAAGCIGNMTYQEAVDLAGMCAPRFAVPAHWEMFTMNSEDPQRFIHYMQVKYPAQQVLLCRHGERVIIPARPASH